MYPFFQVLGRTIGNYALFSFLGFGVAVVVATKLAKKIKIAFEDILLLMLTIGLGTLIGGSFVYSLTNIKKVIYYISIIFDKTTTNSLSFSQIKFILTDCFGGMVFYGGFIGATVALIIHVKVSKLCPLKSITDIFAICVPLFHTFGRIGCFLGGCCYGVESKFGFIAQNELLPEMSGVRRFPISLVESTLNFLIFLFLLNLFKKGKNSGELLFVYMIIYPIIRFCLEFLRGDEIRGIIFGLSTSQWISIIIFIIGNIGYYKTHHHKKDDA